MDVDPPDTNESPFTLLLFWISIPFAPYNTTLFWIAFTFEPKVLDWIITLPPAITSIPPETVDELLIIISPDETIFPADMYVDYVRVYQDVSKVEDISLEKISIHPNPINHFAEISSKQEISEYRVIDIFGRIVCEAQNTSIIDASLFDSGLYIVYVSMSNGQKSRESFMKI